MTDIDLSHDDAADFQSLMNELHREQPSVFTPTAAVTCRGSDEREIAGLERLAAAHLEAARARLEALETGLTEGLPGLIRDVAV
jgi:hypothetical protein